MQEMIGDLFDPMGGGDVVVIPTNTQTKWTKRGEAAVMGAGLAKAAVERYPNLPLDLADLMRRTGPEHVYVFDGLFDIIDKQEYRTVVCLPTKRDWREKSDPALIGSMLDELVFITRAMGWQIVGLPRLGCGLGGLSWEQMKIPMGLKLDDRFLVVNPSGS